MKKVIQDYLGPESEKQVLRSSSGHGNELLWYYGRVSPPSEPRDHLVHGQLPPALGSLFRSLSLVKVWTP